MSSLLSSVLYRAGRKKWSENRWPVLSHRHRKIDHKIKDRDFSTDYNLGKLFCYLCDIAKTCEDDEKH